MPADIAVVDVVIVYGHAGVDVGIGAVLPLDLGLVALDGLGEGDLVGLVVVGILDRAELGGVEHAVLSTDDHGAGAAVKEGRAKETAVIAVFVLAVSGDEALLLVGDEVEDVVAVLDRLVGQAAVELAHAQNGGAPLVATDRPPRLGAPSSMGSRVASPVSRL